MEIRKYMDRELNEEESKSLHWFIDYLNPEYRNRYIFALCDHSVIAVINKEKAPDEETQLREVKRIMDETLRYPPDFSTGVYTDGSAKISMNGGEIAKLIFDRPQEERDTGKLDFGTGYSNRMQIIEACESGKVLALAWYSNN